MGPIQNEPPPWREAKTSGFENLQPPFRALFSLHFFHLTLTAFLAISERCSGEIFFIRAAALFLPPLLPSSAISARSSLDKSSLFFAAFLAIGIEVYTILFDQLKALEYILKPVK